MKKLINENLKETLEIRLQKVNLKDVKIGDIILVEEDENGIEYKVLDLGDPFILIQDIHTNFAYLYEVKNNLFKKSIKVCH